MSLNLMATATENPESHNPEPDNLNPKTLTQTVLIDAKSDPKLGVDIDDNSTTTTTTTTAVVSPTENSNHDNVQKKLRRAERFGVPVQLSEQEKRNSRAERFGIGGGSEASKASEELKRKARAQRFGISAPANEETKKKARLARFGPDTKIDSVEEEKRKARALRFSQLSSNDASHINGKGDIGSNTVIEGSTVGGA